MLLRYQVTYGWRHFRKTETSHAVGRGIDNVIWVKKITKHHYHHAVYNTLVGGRARCGGAAPRLPPRGLRSADADASPGAAARPGDTARMTGRLPVRAGVRHLVVAGPDTSGLGACSVDVLAALVEARRLGASAGFLQPAASGPRPWPS